MYGHKKKLMNGGPDYFTHKQIIESAKQYSFPYKKCAMSRTIHHNRCIDYYFLPALMNCEEIFDVTLMDHTERPEEVFIYEYVTDYAVKAVREHEIERILFFLTQNHLSFSKVNLQNLLHMKFYTMSVNKKSVLKLK